MSERERGDRERINERDGGEVEREKGSEVEREGGIEKDAHKIHLACWQLTIG